jgi:signal transduction histidine kinase
MDLDVVDAFIPEEDHAAVRAAIFGTRDQEVESGFEDRATPSSPRRRIRWHLSRSLDARSLVYGIGIDVTERRALERRAADAEALVAMGELAMHLAHEIRNPLNAAVLQLHLLKRNLDRVPADEGTRTALNDRVRIVGDEIARLNRLLTEFLELARPRGIAREPVHIPKLVEDVLNLEEESANRKQIQLIRRLASEGCVAIGDHEKLKQVTINIVVNALEAMKEGGTLTASVHAEGDHVVMAFEDTGPGFGHDASSHVFDPFFTTKEGGTGLGLSIVRKIVDQHGGNIRISSAPAGGARVTVSIPTGR